MDSCLRTGTLLSQCQNKNTYLFKFTKKAQPGCLKEGNISKITEVDGDALITYNDGTICRVNGQKQKVLWYNSFLATHKAAGDNGAYTFYDGIGGFWVSVSNANYVYQSKPENGPMPVLILQTWALLFLAQPVF